MTREEQIERARDELGALKAYIAFNVPFGVAQVATRRCERIADALGPPVEVTHPLPGEWAAIAASLDEYHAVNLLEALKLVPDTGDWHGSLRAACQMVLIERGSGMRPNKTAQEMIALAQPVEDEDRLTEAEWWERFGEQVGAQKARSIEVTDEMVVRAYRAFLGSPAYAPSSGLRNMRAALRAALEAKATGG